METIPGWFPDWWKPEGNHHKKHVKNTLSLRDTVTIIRGTSMTPTLSAATLALINQAESDLAAAAALDVTAASSATAVTTAQAQATVDSNNALAAHQTANASATAAIQALEAELQQPITGTTPPVAGN